MVRLVESVGASSDLASLKNTTIIGANPQQTNNGLQGAVWKVRVLISTRNKISELLDLET